MRSPIADKTWAWAVTVVFDATLHLDRTELPRFVSTKLLRLEWTGALTDPELDGHVESAGYFTPLSAVKTAIGQTMTKHGVTKRCQQRSDTGMAMKRLVTRALEQQGRMKKRAVSINRYSGYVLQSAKAWLRCSILGLYPHVDHNDRTKSAFVRRRVHQLFTDLRYERWVVNLLYQSIDVLTACVRDFMAYSIRNNPALHRHVADLLRLPDYEAVTRRAVRELTVYVSSRLLDPDSDLNASFATLPARPASLQRMFVCGRTDCGVPCPHKFMKAKEVKTAAAVSPGETEVELMHALIEEMSSDRAVVVQHRKEEVEREAADAAAERVSGWKWKPRVFHGELTALMRRMDADVAYSQPWKLDVLFGGSRKRRKRPTTPILSEDDRTRVAEIVRGCGPVGCGEPMPRIVPFFAFLGVSPTVVAAMVDLVSPALRRTATENKLRSYMAALETYEPRAAELLHEAWECVCAAESHFVLQDLPLNLAKAQLEAQRRVYRHPGPLVDTNVCFAFCPDCGFEYTPLVDATTVYSKVFRYGLKAAAYDPLTGINTCTRKVKRNGQKAVCDARLAFLPLIGRALRWHGRLLVICCQPRCGRVMELDRASAVWNQHGFACQRCAIEDQLAATRNMYDLEFLFASGDAARQECAVHGADAKPKRYKPSQLHIIAPRVYCCSRCYTPEMGKRAMEIGLGRPKALLSMLKEEAANRKPKGGQKRAHRLISQAANNLRIHRPSRKQQRVD